MTVIHPVRLPTQVELILRVLTLPQLATYRLTAVGLWTIDRSRLCLLAVLVMSWWGKQ